MQTKAWISKCGKALFFGTLSSSAGSNGVYPIVPITGVDTTKIPLIDVNGQLVQTASNFIWMNNSLDTALGFLLLECGSVQQVVMINAGSGYTSPTVTSTNGVVLGTPTLKTGICNYIIHNGGSFGSAPGITLSVPNNFNNVSGGTQASAYAIVGGGTITSLIPAADGQLGCGCDYLTYPNLPNVAVGGGTQAWLIPTVSNGVITAITVPYLCNGYGYANNSQINVFDPSGTGATFTINYGDDFRGNYSISSVTVNNGGSNYVRPVLTIAPNGNSVSIEPIVSQYIQYVPVISGGISLTGIPTFSVSDSTGHGAILSAIMTGPGSGDTVTYTAQAGFLETSNGNSASGTNASVDNWVGQYENTTGFNIFATTPTLQAGTNFGEQPLHYDAPTYAVKNQLYRGSFVSSGPGGATFDASGIPISWTQPSTTHMMNSFYDLLNESNLGLKGANQGSEVGQWTQAYDDPAVNTPSGSTMILISDNPYSEIAITPFNISGPHVDTYTAATVNASDITFVNGGGLTSIGVSHSSLGSGYQAAIALVQGGFGSVLNTVVSGGIITGFNIIQPGNGISTAPTINVYGLQCDGAHVTGVWNVTYNTSTPTWWNIQIESDVYQASGQWLIKNPWCVAPNSKTGLACNYFDRKNLMEPDDNVITDLVGNNIKGPASLRFMQATQAYGALSNYINASDLISTISGGSWHYQQTTNINFRYIRFYNTNPANTGYTWSSTKIYGPQSYFCEGNDSFGSYINVPPNDYGYAVTQYQNVNNAINFELRSETPHGLKTGQFVAFALNYNIPVTNFGNWNPGNNQALIVFVTGPYTIASSTFVTVGSGPLAVNSSTELDLSGAGYAQIQLQMPFSDLSIPYEVSAQIAYKCKAGLWLNFPMAAADDLITELGTRIAANFPDGNVYLEEHNEIWNGGDPFVFGRVWYRSLSVLLTYLSVGKKCLDYYVSNSASLTSPEYGSSTLIAAHNQNVFEQAWIKAGRDPARIKRIQASQFNGPSFTQDIIASQTQYGFPIDYIAVAPYMSYYNNDGLLYTAFQPRNTLLNTMGAPVDVLNDWFRHYWTYNNVNQTLWQQHHSYISAVGQPAGTAVISDLFPGSGGSSLFGGGYLAWYTFIDYHGNETTVGSSESVPTDLANNNDILYFQMPPVPLWASGINIYTTSAGEAGQYLYQFAGKTIYVQGQYIPVTSVNTSNPSAPLVNGAGANIGTIPNMCTYEGGLQQIVPDNMAFGPYIQHDSFAHPSMADIAYTFFPQCQVGYQAQANCGAALANWYICFNTPVYPTNWMLAYGIFQPPGDGSTNLFATAQGGYPADCIDHNGGSAISGDIVTQGNRSTALHGFLQYIGKTLLPQPANPVPQRFTHLRHKR